MAEGYEVFKVVRRRTDNQLVSCFAPDKLRVYYKIGEKSIPKVGKLFCFQNLISAQHFIKEMCFFTCANILLCETNSVDFLTNIERIPQGCCGREYDYSYRIFWQNPQIWRESHNGNNIPEGTVFCDYVIPLEEVDPCM